MTESLLQKGKTVTAITRADSTSKLPNGVQVKKVDYENPSTIVEALRGQDALIITLSITAPQGTQDKLLEAAAEAKVPWVLPNEWGPDTKNEGLAKDVVGFGHQEGVREKIKQLGLSYISVSTGFWYEWSLAIPAGFGIDSLKQEATLFDEGETKITISTWPQVGRAVAGLLSLPIRPEGGNKDACLEHFRNTNVYVGSFTVSQKDMLDSALRVIGTKIEDWKITKEPAQQRYKEGLEAMKGGDRMGFPKQMYSRVFYPDNSGNHEKTRGLVNDLLGLPKEDIDEATKRAIQRQRESPWG